MIEIPVQWDHPAAAQAVAVRGLLALAGVRVGINLATFYMRVDGLPTWANLYAAAHTHPSGAGRHSERVCADVIGLPWGLVHPNWGDVIAVFTERFPCGVGHHNCRGNLETTLGPDVPVYYLEEYLSPENVKKILPSSEGFSDKDRRDFMRGSNSVATKALRQFFVQ